MLRRPARMLVLSVGAIALGAAGCASAPDGAIEAAAVQCPEGSDCYDVPRAVGEGGAFTIDAGEFFFENLEGSYWAGDIEVTLDNVGSAEHNIVITGANEGSDVPIQALGGEQATGTINLFEGEYIYYCSIPGHRGQGMEGELTVFATEDEAAENLTEAPSDQSVPQPEDDESIDGNEGGDQDEPIDEPDGANDPEIEVTESAPPGEDSGVPATEGPDN